MFQPNEHVADYVAHYLQGVLEPADVRHVEQHCAACPACQAALDTARRHLAALQALPPREASEQLVQRINARIDTYEHRRRNLRRLFGWGTLVGTAAAVLVLVGLQLYYHSLTPSPYNLALLGQTQLFPGTPGSMCIRLVHQATGKPMSAVPVTVDLHDRPRGQVVRLANLQLDAQGTGQPRFDVPDWADGSYELCVVARPDGNTEELSQPIRLQRSWKLMLSSDRPVYQPGHEIHLRALALRRPDLKPVAKQEAVFAITDPKGNVIFKRQGTTSAYGITSADCLLATEVIEGPYTIACKLGDTESKLTVEVKKYVLPKFKIDVQGLDSFYQTGQTVKGTIKAEYFFGGPVAGGTVDLEVHTAILPPDEGNPPQQDRREGEPRAPRVPGLTPQPNQRLTLKTDATGQTAFECKLPNILHGREMDGGDARVALQVKVRDTAGQEERKAVSRLVTSRPLRVAVIPEGGTLVQGIRNTVYFFASYADGRPAGQTQLSILRPGGSEMVLLTNGLGVASFEFTPGSGTEQLTVQANDSKGRTFQQTVQLSAGQVSDDFILRPDRAVYTGGDTMQLLALGGGPSTVYVDLIKDGQTYLSDTIDMANGRGELKIDLPPDLAGTVELCTYRFGRDGLPVRKARVFYVRQARQLNIQTTLDQAEYRPGRQAKLTFQLSDQQGKPIPGALSLAAVDEAVFSVLDQAPGMERVFYTLEQELLQPVYALYPWSPDQQAPLPPEERNQFELALFSRTVQTSSESGGPVAVSDRPIGARQFAPMPDQAPVTVRRSSPHSLSVFSYPLHAQEIRDRRENGMEWVLTGWLTLAAVLLVTGYLAMWNFARWTVILGVHALVLPLLACLVLIGLLGSSASMRFDMVAGSLVKSAEDRAVLTEAAAMEAIDDDAGGSPVRVRQHFPETLLWRPELITDDQGRAKLDLDLADSITTWRLTTSAVSVDGRLGGSQTPIRVFQPFFVDINLPVSLTRGDEVAVPVVVYNYLAKPQAVALTLTQANWFDLVGPAEQSIELKAKEVRSTSYRLKVKKAGRHELQVMAQAATVADAIKRSIDVVPDGRKVEQVVTDRLNGSITWTVTIPEHAVEDSQKILVKLYPGVYSQVVEGVEGMVRQPFG